MNFQIQTGDKNNNQNNCYDDWNKKKNSIFQYKFWHAQKKNNLINGFSEKELIQIVVSIMEDNIMRLLVRRWVLMWTVKRGKKINKGDIAIVRHFWNRVLMEVVIIIIKINKKLNPRKFYHYVKIIWIQKVIILVN